MPRRPSRSSRSLAARSSVYNEPQLMAVATRGLRGQMHTASVQRAYVPLRELISTPPVVLRGREWIGEIHTA